MRPITSFVASVALTAAANFGFHGMSVDENHSTDIVPRAALDIPDSSHQVATVIRQNYTETFGPYTMPYAPNFAESSQATLVDSQDIDDIARRVVHAQQAGEKDVHIEVIGMSSDEAGALPGQTDPQHGLGETNERNQLLAGVRGQAVANHLKTAFEERGVNVETWVMSGQESVLSKSNVNHLAHLASQYSLSLDGMITAYNQKHALPQPIEAELDATLASQRGARVEIHGSRPVYLAPAPIVNKAEGQKTDPQQEEPKPFDQTPDNLIPLVVPVATRRRPQDEADFGGATITAYERADPQNEPQKQEALV